MEEWKQRLVSGGRSGLNDTELILAARYAAKVQKNVEIAGNDLNLAKVIAKKCGHPTLKGQQGWRTNQRRRGA